MKNKHGLECPVLWEDVLPEHEWVATDENGAIWSYKDRPKIFNNKWEAFNYSLKHIHSKGLPPTDFTKCLWQRPKTESKIKNKHGLMPPIPWEKTMYDWQAIQPDGSVYVYGKKPIKGIDLWFNSDSNWDLVAKVNPPKDFSKCLWKHPKIKSK